jgi:hypothetical protein
MGLRQRLARVERLLPPAPPEDRARQRQWEKVFARWERLLGAAVPLLSTAERPQVEGAVAQLADAPHGPYAAWLRDLSEGRCRLPELAPAVMRELLLAWLSPQADGGMVCRRCGLEYPRHRSPPLSEWKLLPGRKPLEGPPPWYDLPELFRTCPGCGASRYDIDWPHLTREGHPPWKDLDGFVGEGRRG